MKRLATLIIAMMLLLGIAGMAAAQSTLDVVKKRGKLIAGVRFDSPPFGYLDAKQQNVGFDVELLKALAKKLGVELELRQVTAETRIPMLINGDIDMFAAICTHTIKRDEFIDYSLTYYVTGQKILVKKGSNIKGIQDMAGKKVAALQGSSSLVNLQKMQPRAEVLPLVEYPQCLEAVLKGEADAMTGDAVVLHGLARDNPQVEVVGVYLTREPYGMGVRENDSKWRDFINFALQEMWASGEFARLHQRVFGTAPDFSVDLWQ